MSDSECLKWAVRQLMTVWLPVQSAGNQLATTGTFNFKSIWKGYNSIELSTEITEH